MNKRIFMMMVGAAFMAGGFAPAPAKAGPNCEIPGKCGPGDWPIPPVMTIKRPSDDTAKPPRRVKTLSAGAASSTLTSR